MESQAHPHWLSLNKAAKHIGVHPNTLRRWADAGLIRVMLTPGGHRRFATSDLDQFTSDSSHAEVLPNHEANWAERAMTQTHRELSVHQNEAWMTAYTDNERDVPRKLGHRMMGVLLQYVAAKNGEQWLSEAADIGRAYAHSAKQHGMPFTAVLRAIFFFRDTLQESTLSDSDGRVTSVQSSMRLMRRVNKLLNVVQLAVAEVYETTAQ